MFRHVKTHNDIKYRKRWIGNINIYLHTYKHLTRHQTKWDKSGGKECARIIFWLRHDIFQHKLSRSRVHV